jgi:hypothetical protein
MVSHRVPPAGFIQPCLPVLADRPPIGAGWGRISPTSFWEKIRASIIATRPAAILDWRGRRYSAGRHLHETFTLCSDRDRPAVQSSAPLLFFFGTSSSLIRVFGNLYGGELTDPIAEHRHRI